MNEEARILAIEASKRGVASIPTNATLAVEVETFPDAAHWYSYYETIEKSKKRLGLIIAQTVSIITLIIALIFASIARNNAEQRAETMQAAVEEHEAFESVLQTENQKVRVSAMAAATQLKNHSENMAELQGILENQMKDIDTLFAERNALRAEVETLREQIGENPYKDIKMTKDERDLFEKILALEAKGEPVVGQRAVVEAVFNRLLRRDWKGETVKEILLAPGQFDAVNHLSDPYAEPDQKEADAIDYVLTHGRTILPEDYVYFATYKANGRDFIRIGNHYFSRG